MSEPPDAEAGDRAGAGSVAGRLFGERLPQAVAFATLLAGDGVDHGLIGPREAGRLWGRHLLPGAAVATLIPRAARICDVGSGAGLPGLALALARPDLSVVLLEPMARRCAFLRRAVDVTATGARVEVRQGRAEDLTAEQPDFDVVTARAVARLPALLGWLLPLCRPGGQVLAIKGAAVAVELAEAAGVLGGSVVRRWDLVELGIPGATDSPGAGASDVVRVVRVVTAANVITPQPQRRPSRSRGTTHPAGRRTGRP